MIKLLATMPLMSQIGGSLTTTRLSFITDTNIGNNNVNIIGSTIDIIMWTLAMNIGNNIS